VFRADNRAVVTYVPADGASGASDADGADGADEGDES
jgi:hypothetical protein